MAGRDNYTRTNQDALFPARPNNSAARSRREDSAIAIQVQNLAHEFGSERGESLPVIAELNLEITAGEIVAIVGPSGSGKTTFLNLVAGGIAPTRGHILFGDNISPKNSAPGSFGMVFQQPALLPWRSIYDNVRLPLELIGEDSQSAKTVQSALKIVELTGFDNYLPEQVSGGMQSRAAFARALVTEPKFLLMDEPFGALDELTAQNLSEQVSHILHVSSITALVVSHHLELATFLANRVLVFSKRPATIVGEVHVDLPTPRGLEALDSPIFHDCLKQVRAYLRRI